MEKLEQRIRQLEIELIGEKVKNGLLFDKFGVTIEELRAYAHTNLIDFPESEKNGDMYHFLTGLVKGEAMVEKSLNDE
ncbi:hypothetical protein [uncultured Vagococcus sp.]|uniref:hypothetical protein n=1 Tax=uncultured Vagococcus sp. TaxID=189676 RepID=UPI0028D4B50C|nr:hypothetical protein [uncultured Vagococcus sp.]